MTNDIRVQMYEIVNFMTTIMVIAMITFMVRSVIKGLTVGNPNTHDFELVKRTTRGSLVTITKVGRKARLEITNHEDMQEISNLLNVAKIKWEMHKPTIPHPRRPDTAFIIEFDFGELERVIKGVPFMLEGRPSNPALTYSPLVRYQDELMSAAESKIGSDNEKVRKAADLLSHDLTYYWDSQKDVIIAWSPEREILGFAIVRDSYDRETALSSIHIHSLGSLSSEPGIGSALVKYAIDVAKSTKKGAVTVYSEPENKPFYGGLGFSHYRHSPNPGDLVYYLPKRNPEMAFPFSLAEMDEMKKELLRRGLPQQDAEELRITITDPWGPALTFNMLAQYIYPGLIEFYNMPVKKFDDTVRYLYVDGWFTKEQLRLAYIWHLAHEIGHHLGKSEHEAEEYAAQILGPKSVLLGGIREKKQRNPDAGEFSLPKIDDVFIIKTGLTPEEKLLRAIFGMGTPEPALVDETMCECGKYRSPEYSRVKCDRCGTVVKIRKALILPINWTIDEGRKWYREHSVKYEYKPGYGYIRKE